jgi:hypothetical protein
VDRELTRLLVTAVLFVAAFAVLMAFGGEWWLALILGCVAVVAGHEIGERVADTFDL